MSATIAKLPAPVLACVLAIRNAWPAARTSASIDGSCAIEIPHRSSGFIRAYIYILKGEAGVWLEMPFGLPFGKAKYPTAVALVEGLRGAIERVG